MKKKLNRNAINVSSVKNIIKFIFVCNRSSREFDVFHQNTFLF